MKPRLILFHKQATSGRLRFLRLPDGMLWPTALPTLASLQDESHAPPVAPHPALLLKKAEESLGLPPGSLAAEAEFRAWVDTPEGDVPILLAGFTTTDPPFQAAESLSGRFIAITEARGLPQVELLLLRHAYEQVLG